jgi:hypothetical protein
MLIVVDSFAALEFVSFTVSILQNCQNFISYLKSSIFHQDAVATITHRAAGYLPQFVFREITSG